MATTAAIGPGGKASAAVTVRPGACSGDSYCGVPMNPPLRVGCVDGVQCLRRAADQLEHLGQRQRTVRGESVVERRHDVVALHAAGRPHLAFEADPEVLLLGERAADDLQGDRLVPTGPREADGTHTAFADLPDRAVSVRRRRRWTWAPALMITGLGS
ncbi:hypothetical protein ACFCXH_32390 [Streptomyces nojiriensis]|uniref:hypothetical protein n=1 Tax=Streptomyces nojiriensis TaxID=66374 RepID=UPI0035D90AA4